MKQAVEALSDLLVREIFAALQSCFAKLDRCDESGFFCEIAAEKFAGEFLRAFAFLGCDLRKLSFLLGGKSDLHDLRVRTAGCGVNRFSAGGPG